MVNKRIYFSCLGIFAVALLLRQYLGGQATHCLVGDCSKIMRAGLALNLPLPLPTAGLIAHLAYVFLACQPGGKATDLARQGLAVSMFLASLGLTIFGWVTAQSFCPWCLLNLFSCAGLATLDVADRIKKVQWSELASVAMVAGVTVAAVLGTLFPSFESPTKTNLKLESSEFQSLRIFPSLYGSPTAAHRALAIDFSCPHCREALRSLGQKKEPTLVITLADDRLPASGQLASLFQSACRQGYGEKFAERVPEENQFEWMQAIRLELKPTGFDVKATNICLSQSAKVKAKYAINLLPFEIFEVPSATMR